MLSLIILTLAGICVLLLTVFLVFNPIQRSIGFANVSRRKWNSTLVVAGSMVGTALIAGSLVMSDTTERTLQDAVFTHMGEIDITVRGKSPSDHDNTPLTSSVLNTLSLDQLRETTGDQVDGVLEVVERELPVAKIEPASSYPDGFELILAEPKVTVVGFDFTDLDGFGSHSPNPAALQPLDSGHAYVSSSLARELELASGDTISAYFRNRPTIFEVADVVPDAGISGRRMDIEDSKGTMLVSLSDARTLMGIDEDQVNTVYISLKGDVVGGVKLTDSVGGQMKDLLARDWPDLEWDIRYEKQDALNEDGDGPGTGEIFLMVSSFAILAGVMLIINIYSMLAEERRTEMGIMRAVALNRQQLVMTFAYEGFIYSAVASVVGVAVGAGLGALVVTGLSEILSQDQSSTLEGLPLTINLSTIAVSGAAGLLISFLTAFATSVHISRLNIVLAIRNLPEPPSEKPSRWRLIAALTTLAAGTSASVLGFANDNGYLQYIGPCVISISCAAIVGRFVPSRVAFTVAGSAIIVYSFLADRLEPVEKLIGDGPGLFVLSGIFMLLAGMMIIAFNLSLVLLPLRLGTSGLNKMEPVVRIAIAYSVMNRARTSFTIGMFGLVMFGVTLITVYSGLLDGFVNTHLDQAAGGFDVVVYNNQNNPIGNLEALVIASGKVPMDEIDSVMPVYRAPVKFPDFERPSPGTSGAAGDPEDNYVSDSIHGVSRTFAAHGQYPLDAKMERFASDEEAWAAVASDTHLSMVSSRYDGTHKNTGNALLEPGDSISLLNPGTGDVIEKTVAGRMNPIEVNFGVLRGVVVGMNAYHMDFAGSSPLGDHPRLFVIELVEGADLTAVGKQIEKAVVTSGARVVAVHEVMRERFAQTSIFLRIFQGFLSFGLIVGIAGLAVIAARSVQQRRHGIGTLRALGFQPGMVLTSMLIEWSFIALAGIVLGVGLGLVGGYRLFVLFVREAGGTFEVPWLEIIGITTCVYLASLASTVFPALKASRMPPAEALRHQE